MPKSTTMFQLIWMVILLQFGCTPHADNVNDSNLVRVFFQQSTKGQVATFKSYAIEEQYDLYIWGNQVVHPPAIYLAEPFAEEGPAIIPFLVERLRTSESEVTVRDITLVFSEMAARKLYAFSKDSELMRLLDQRADAMKGVWKGTTLRHIAEIRSEGKEKERGKKRG